MTATTDNLTDTIPWIRRIEDTDPLSDDDVRISTTLGVCEIDPHLHTIENHGYTVNRIGYTRAYGMDIYCDVRE